MANDNCGAGTISMIDLLADNLLKDNIVGLGITPNAMIWHGGSLFVINSASNDMNVFSLNYNNDLTLLETLDIGSSSDTAGLSPQYADIADNGRMFISNYNSNNVSVYDLSLRRTLLKIDVGKAPADVMAIGDKVYVCNSGFDAVTWEYDPGTVYVISTTENFVVDTINVGINPQFMALDPIGRLHIVCTGDYNSIGGKIYVVNTANNQIVQVINIGGTPSHLAINQDNKAYVAAGGGWGVDGPGHVYLYDAATGEDINGPSNPILVNTGAWRVAVGSGDAVYVACLDGDSVDKIVGDQVVLSYPAGDGPSAMFLLER